MSYHEHSRIRCSLPILQLPLRPQRGPARAVAAGGTPYALLHDASNEGDLSLAASWLCAREFQCQRRGQRFGPFLRPGHRPQLGTHRNGWLPLGDRSVRREVHGFPCRWVLACSLKTFTQQLESAGEKKFLKSLEESPQNIFHNNSWTATKCFWHKNRLAHV